MHLHIINNAQGKSRLAHCTLPRITLNKQESCCEIRMEADVYSCHRQMHSDWCPQIPYYEGKLPAGGGLYAWSDPSSLAEPATFMLDLAGNAMPPYDCLAAAPESLPLPCLFGSAGPQPFRTGSKPANMDAEWQRGMQHASLHERTRAHALADQGVWERWGACLEFGWQSPRWCQRALSRWGSGCPHLCCSQTPRTQRMPCCSGLPAKQHASFDIPPN